MNRTTLSLLCAGLLAAVPVAQAPLTQPLQYEFQSGMIDGDGIRSLADMRGRPVLIEIWGST